MARAVCQRMMEALFASPLFGFGRGRAGLCRGLLAAALLGALVGLLLGATGCAEIVGFGDHEVGAACGDGEVGGAEGCDDGDAASGDGCSAACSVEEGFYCVGAPSVCSTKCADGKPAGAEGCDDGNTAAGDGCSAACSVEAGYACSGAPSVCKTACGDGLVAAAEACDDGNAAAGDGCSGVCSIEAGYTCGGAPSACEEICGDGLVVGAEGCDDGGLAGGDGCSAGCAVEAGFSCVGVPSACAEVCGDGLVVGDEGCDDKNVSSDDGCSAACAIEPGYSCGGAPSACGPVCGDGLVVGGEGCDDKNVAPNDGCSAACVIETGYACAGAPSACGPVCGDGLVVGGEGCDDKNVNPNDGCSALCTVEAGFACNDAPSQCAAICGDGLVVGGEGCDDKNLAPNDGCSAACAIETGYACSGAPSACGPVCGDGLLRGGEACDDGDLMSFDGCSALCAVEAGYMCSGEASVCVATCGDGVLAVGAEQCDDGALVANDCCSPTCKLEAAGCEAEPNNTLAQANDFAALSVMGTMKAFIKPAADIDIFRLTVPPNGVGDLAAKTLDGMLGTTCASNAVDTKVTIRDAFGVAMTFDDDSGPGLCSDAAILGLPPGDYFVEVIDSPSGAALSYDYSLAITFMVAVCGNGAKEGVEQCDDGNTMSGDGCSPVCLFEMESEDEAGGNNACADTSGPYSPPVLIAGAITPVGDLDYFAFTVPATADIRVETFGSAGPGSCPMGLVDTRVELRGQDCTSILAVDDDDGLNSCSLINPASAPDVGARHVPPGTYFIRVEELGNNAEILPGYSAYITFTALCGDGVKEGSEECDAAALPTATCDASCERIPVCGDMFLDGPETCDDGNTANGDGCSAACQVEGVIAEWEPNGTIGEAMSAPITITGDTYVTGTVGVIGDKDIFKLMLTQPAVVRLETFDASFIDCAGGAATTLRLFNAGGMQIFTNDSSGIESCSALVVRLAMGTYYVQVEEFGNNAPLAGYALEVDLQAEVGAEVEGNDGTQNATVFAGSDVVILGGHQVNTDADYYAITVPDSWSIRAEVIEGSLAETCDLGGIDSHLTLFDPGGLQLAVADDFGRGFCSLMDGTGSFPQTSAAHALPGGTYFLRVQASPFAQMGLAGQFDYRLALTLRSP